jgi:methyl-accepting chemotaxis protein
MKLLKLIQDLPIAAKIAIAPLAAVLCLLAVAAQGLLASQSLLGSLHEMEDRTLASLSEVAGLERRVSGLYGDANRSFSWTGAEFPAERIEALDKQLTQEFGLVAEQIKQQRRSALWDEAAQSHLAALDKNFAAFSRAALDALDMKSSGLSTTASFIDSMQTAYGGVTKDLSALAEAQRVAARRRLEASTATAARNRWGMLAGAALAVALAAGAGWWCARLIVGPLRRARRIAAALAEGDLSEREAVAQRDETGQLVQALAEVSAQLGRLVAEVRDSAGEVRTASSEIAQGNADLSGRTEQRSARLQQAASAVEQLTHSVQHNAKSASDADRLAQEASQVAREGGAAVAEVVRTMEALQLQARRISEITGVIDGIAFQTNILALNAAVEAARAGEQGRGFAVVAGEVRSLAQRAGEAAKEIRVLIGRSVEHTEAGSARVETAGATMQRIEQAIGRATTVMAEIATASREQATGVQDISTSLGELDRSAQQDAALVEQAAAAAESLRGQSERLNSLLTGFRLERA